jgi:sulfur carrier protein ThiS
MFINLEIIGWLKKEKGINTLENYEIFLGASVNFLIDKVKLKNYPVIVLVNNKKVERNFILKNGDLVKIIPIVGGG